MCASSVCVCIAIEEDDYAVAKWRFITCAAAAAANTSSRLASNEPLPFARGKAHVHYVLAAAAAKAAVKWF